MRKANGPSFVGSPYRTAASAPGGRTGGAGPHWTSVGVMTLCISAVWPGIAPAKQANASALSANGGTIFMGTSCDCPSCSASPNAGETRWPHPRSIVDAPRSEEHTSELQSRQYLVCRLLLEKKTEVRMSV